ncbi:MAG: HAD family hydrolase [Bacteroidales bacterium]|nr:HAD family hydrolase [Bacteroidales bacterium]
MKDIKGVIFDYGGTIDTNGIHWGEVIREEYRRAGVMIEKTLFREAYVYAERALAKAPIINADDTFRTLLHKKMALQAEYLNGKSYPIDNEKAGEIADGCYRRVLDTLATSRTIVEELSDRYPTVLVTNFYGNMPVVLKEFGLDSCFGHIIESAVVGLRKPDPALFAKGVEALGLEPFEVVVIGDSYRKDIHPARTLGCKAVWLKKRCWEEEPILPGAEPTAIISSLEELPAIIKVII